MPIAALLTCQRFQRHTIDRLVIESGSTQGIIDAQRTFLVGAQYKPRAKLLVVIAHGELHILVMTFHIEMRHAPSLEIRLKTWQRILQELKTSAGIHIFAAQFQVHIGIGQHFVIGMLCSNFIVLLREKDVTLDAAAERHLSSST